MEYCSGNAPAFYKTTPNAELDDISENQCILGLIPHSIRGFLSTFNQVLPATEKYKQCIGCSDIVINAYLESENEFLLKVFNSSKHLEDVTGLTEIYKDSNFDDVKFPTFFKYKIIICCFRYWSLIVMMKKVRNLLIILNYILQFMQ